MSDAVFCAHCGRRLVRFEAAISGTQVCHPNDPGLLDCYRLITIYHENIGDRLPEVPLP